jgi:F-type H+-transporting ATPase subunit a
MNNTEQVANTTIEHNHQNNSKNASQHEENQDVFTSLLNELGDHSGFYIGPHKISELPVIIVDNGLYVYSSPTKMLQAGVYTIKGHGEIVRSSDGGKPALDLSITNLVVFQWIAILILTFIFTRVGKKYKKEPTKAPSGFQNIVETFVLYIRDEVVRPNIPSLKTADKLLPYFLGLFFFILILNLIGLIPGGHTATGAIPVTLALAITAFFVINITAMKVSGVGNWFKHLTGGAPWYLWVIMIPIEIVGLFIKPFALTIRLFANMSAGHIVLFSLLGLLFFFENIFLAPAIVGFSIFIHFLELLVAFLQAYIFTMLTAIFVGLAIGEHTHEEAH